MSETVAEETRRELLRRARLFLAALKPEQERGNPHACSCSSVEMLGLWLADAHGIESEYVRVERSEPEFWTHAWLRAGGDLIDIGCDDFSEWKAGAPYVGPETLWHRSSWRVVDTTAIREQVASARDSDEGLGDHGWEETYTRVVARLSANGSSEDGEQEH